MAESKTVQILKTLKKISDESHPVTQAQLLDRMKDDGAATTENPATLSSTVDEILRQINPIEYTGENDSEYRIKYKGYERNLLDEKEAIRELKKSARRKDADLQAIEEELSHLPSKAPSITNLMFIHDFSEKEMDQLIQAVSFSNAISSEDKLNLIRKILNTASEHYKTPFYDKGKNKLRFNPKGVFSRTYVMPDETAKEDNESLGNNVMFIQNAINDGVCIRFHFNYYDADKKMVSKSFDYTLSPYYIVVYHDMYYLLGNMPGENDISHYRIDLMTDITILTDDNGEPVKRESMSRFKELEATSGTWNPVKYMSEHLYMGWDKPKSIRIKIPDDQYTVLHDWFGNYYKKSRTPCEEEGFDYVDVVTSPSLIVPWAMQYAGRVEIMDEEIREKIREEIRRLEEKYGE